jgi:hypothetical protein
MDTPELTRRRLIAAGVGLAAAATAGSMADAAAQGTGPLTLMQLFLKFSVEATGFSREDLESTGQITVYLNKVREIIGENNLDDFLQTYRDGGLNAVLVSEKLGAIARNIIKLWYIATWDQLPRGWKDKYGELAADRTFIIGPEAYAAGLLWPAIGVSPPGAGAPGYGTWSNPPNVIE